MWSATSMLSGHAFVDEEAESYVIWLSASTRRPAA
jgi:hypothetical protein